MLENFQGDSWGSIPPLRMLSLLPHDLCHGRSSSRWLPTVIEFQMSYFRSWKMMLWKVLHSICNMPAPGSNPLQYSGLENPMDRGAWRATVSTQACHTETKKSKKEIWAVPVKCKLLKYFCVYIKTITHIHVSWLLSYIHLHSYTEQLMLTQKAFLFLAQRM